MSDMLLAMRHTVIQNTYPKTRLPTAARTSLSRDVQTRSSTISQAHLLHRTLAAGFRLESLAQRQVSLREGVQRTALGLPGARLPQGTLLQRRQVAASICVMRLVADTLFGLP